MSGSVSVNEALPTGLYADPNVRSLMLRDSYLMDGERYVIPAFSSVWPVYANANGKLWAARPTKTFRPSEHSSFRLLPADGSFRSFHFRNEEKDRKFAIALFDQPVQQMGKTIIGCVVDMLKIQK